VIWKYEIPISVRECFLLAMPKGARILKLALQNGVPTLWAMVDSHAGYETRKFALVLTGSPITIEGEYIDTFLLEDDSFVLHLFEVTNTE
jgi:hypothetical protein